MVPVPTQMFANAPVVTWETNANTRLATHHGKTIQMSVTDTANVQALMFVLATPITQETIANYQNVTT
jgi:hypothetical protein